MHARVQVLVSTPTKNYTLGELGALFRAMGDDQSVSGSHNAMKAREDAAAPPVLRNQTR